MSWLRDTEADVLLNLEHADKVTIEEIVEREGEPEKLHGLAVWMAGDDEPDIVFVGSQDACLVKLDILASRLPLLKGVL